MLGELLSVLRKISELRANFLKHSLKSHFHYNDPTWHIRPLCNTVFQVYLMREFPKCARNWILTRPWLFELPAIWHPFFARSLYAGGPLPSKSHPSNLSALDFCNSLIWNIEFDELDFYSISNLNFTAYSRQKNRSFLKYGFCKKLLWYKWTYDQLNTFVLTFCPDQY